MASGSFEITWNCDNGNVQEFGNSRIMEEVSSAVVGALSVLAAWLSI